MSANWQKSRWNLEARKYIRRSMKMDRINPQDFARLNLVFACEQCSHFSNSESRCTMGYIAQFRRADQLLDYNLTGFMKFCRFQEID